MQLLLTLIASLLFNTTFIFSFTLNEVPSNNENATVEYQCNSIKGIVILTVYANNMVGVDLFYSAFAHSSGSTSSATPVSLLTTRIDCHDMHYNCRFVV